MAADDVRRCQEAMVMVRGGGGGGGGVLGNVHYRIEKPERRVESIQNPFFMNMDRTIRPTNSHNRQRLRSTK